MTAAGLEPDLPMNVRKTAVASAMAMLAKERAARGAETKIIRLEKGYHVRLTVKDGDTVMMETLLYASDSIQANAVADAFMENPANLYGGIIDALKL